MSNINHKSRWFINAVIGLLLTGAGLSMAIDAGFEKYTKEPYVVYGTISLVIFNAGLCFIGQAVYHKGKINE